MDLWITRLTRELRKFDRDLFARRDGEFVNVYRWRKFYQRHDLEGGTALFVVDRQPGYIMSLTSNWSLTGKPVAWGIEPIMQRIQEIDAHNRDVYANLMAEREKAEKSKERAESGHFEDIARETRNEFKQAFADYNVSQLAPKRKV